jgi:prevent-host-death family protein
MMLCSAEKTGKSPVFKDADCQDGILDFSDRPFFLASAAKSMHFSHMKATLTELRRDTGRVMDAVIHRHHAVELTKHGETVADIQPRAKPLSGAEFARRWKNRKPLDKETAKEIAAATKSLDQAG